MFVGVGYFSHDSSHSEKFSLLHCTNSAKSLSRVNYILKLLLKGLETEEV